MSLTAEAIDLLQKSGEPVGTVVRVVGVDGIDRPYAVESLRGEHGSVGSESVRVRLIEDPKPAIVETLVVPTLSALVGYLKRNIDGLDLAAHMLVVIGPLKVELQSKPRSSYLLRQVPVRSVGAVPALLFGNWLTLEQAHVWLRTGFEADPEPAGARSQDDRGPGGSRSRLLALLSQVTTEAAIRTDDDGVSQKVTTVKGLTLKEETAAPTTVELAPYRSFVGEVEQVPSPFIFRVRGGEGRPVEVQISEADGGAWALEARLRLADRLRALLGDAGLDPDLVVG